MFSSESTNVERLNDCRNVRRDANKSVVPSRTGQALRQVPTPLLSALRFLRAGLAFILA